MKIRDALIGAMLIAVLISCASGSDESPAASKVVEPAAGQTITQQLISNPPLLNANHYAEFTDIRKEGPVVPGIFQGAVPQGMAYEPRRDLLLISNYMDDGRQSCIVSVSLSDGLLQRVFWIEEPDGSPHTGHVGGLAVSTRHLWVASGQGVFFADLDSLDGGELMRMTGFVATAAKGSFATFADDTLWVGEFTRSDGSYPVPRSHNVRSSSGVLNLGWMAGFVLDPDTDMVRADSELNGVAYPDRIISIPHEVQGAAFYGPSIVLSHSYGRQNKSRISVYGNPMDDLPTESFNRPDGSLIPIWVLDASYLTEVIVAPPMSEGIVAQDGGVIVLFESGSDKYRETALDPMDRVQILQLEGR